jgi:steroid delta-isomerase
MACSSAWCGAVSRPRHECAGPVPSADPAARSALARLMLDDPRVLRVRRFYEGLQENNLPQLDALYAGDARFKDPFNDVRGVDAIRAIFAHMFRTLREPRFVVLDAVTQQDQCFLTWDFHFTPQRGGAAMLIHGATHLRFGSDGRIIEHRDYWDAAEELYEKLPLIGALMRWLKRRAAG